MEFVGLAGVRVVIRDGPDRQSKIGAELLAASPRADFDQALPGRAGRRVRNRDEATAKAMDCIGQFAQPEGESAGRSAFGEDGRLFA